MRLHHRSVCPLLASALALAVAGPASAAFVEDSKASIDLRNFYMNRDFRSGDGQSKAEEWAQGFMLKMASGYTEGPLGFGLDAIGLLGVKLDSSPDRVGTGLLQSDREAPNRAQDDYGSAGLTAKARLSATTLHVGTLQPLLPVVMRNDSRLLPQTFRGAWLQSKEIDGLTLDAGKLDRVNQRNSSDNEQMTAFNGGKRNIVFGRQTSSDQFLFAGGRYAWSPELSTSYYYGGLEDIYRGTTWAWFTYCRSARDAASRPTCATCIRPMTAVATSTPTPSACCSATSTRNTPSAQATSASMAIPASPTSPAPTIR